MKDKCPLISIVMLNYNGLKYLKRTIHPILKLDYPNYEFIIVDNGSNDGSIEFIKRLRKIRLIENGKNLGYSKGKNIGIKHARGEYILLLDNDMLIITDNLLKKLIINSSSKKMLQIPFLDLKKFKTKSYGIFYNYLGQNFSLPLQNIKDILNYKEGLIKIGSMSGGLMFFNKKSWIKVGGFDESQPFNLDDTDVGPRAWIEGYKIYLYTGLFIIHLGINNMLSNEEYIRRFELLFSGQIRSIIKNYNFWNLITRLPLAILFHFIKCIRYTIIRKDIRIFFAFLFSVKLFLKNLPDTLKQRSIVQSKRVIKGDIFLKIKPPKFD